MAKKVSVLSFFSQTINRFPGNSKYSPPPDAVYPDVSCLSCDFFMSVISRRALSSDTVILWGMGLCFVFWVPLELDFGIKVSQALLFINLLKLSAFNLHFEAKKTYFFFLPGVWWAAEFTTACSTSSRATSLLLPCGLPTFLVGWWARGRKLGAADINTSEATNHSDLQEERFILTSCKTFRKL